MNAPKEKSEHGFLIGRWKDKVRVLERGKASWWLLPLALSCFQSCVAEADSPPLLRSAICSTSASFSVGGGYAKM